MTKKKDNKLPDFIEDLSKDLKPCTPLKHPLLRMAPWLLVAPLYIYIVAVFVIGLRPDWQEMLMHRKKEKTL